MPKIFLPFLSLLLLLPFSVFAADSFPSFPMAFWGTADINGRALAVGTEIQAYCGTSLIGEVTMAENGIYGYTDSTKIKLLISSCSGGITFEYVLPNTITALTGATALQYTDGFVSGQIVNENLNFITTQSCTISNGLGSQVWSSSQWGTCTVVSCNSGYTQSGNSCLASYSGGGGGGGSSGGGGGSVSTVATTATPVVSTGTIRGDANNDGVVNILDYNSLMVSWGKGGSNISDLNGDGIVDILDYNMLMVNWTK
jgi:hypothetical protein